MNLNEEKWVRIMADYSADGIWSKDGCGCDIEELPVTQELRNRILTWSLAYEYTDSVRPSRVPPQFWVYEGLEIARAVKCQLPDWVVIYFDEIKCSDHMKNAGHKCDRSYFEYEIV